MSTVHYRLDELLQYVALMIHVEMRLDSGLRLGVAQRDTTKILEWMSTRGVDKSLFGYQKANAKAYNRYYPKAKKARVELGNENSLLRLIDMVRGPTQLDYNQLCRTVGLLSYNLDDNAPAPALQFCLSAALAATRYLSTPEG